MRIVGLVPARGGSKGIPRKNIRLLCGRPLLHYTSDAALACRSLSRVLLSTEDDEVAAIGRAGGLEVPFLRPTELANDCTPMLPVILHAVAWLETHGEQFDAICLLQPTNPLRRPEDIDGCVDLLVRDGADAVVTVLPVPAEHNPHWTYLRGEDGFLRLSTGESEPISRRQDLPAAFHREGSVYVTRRDVLVEGRSLYGQRLAGYPMPAERCVNLDAPEDWERAERLVRELAT